MSGTVAEKADIILRLDLEGFVREASFANSCSGEPAEGWIGRPWADTEAGARGDLIRQIVADVRANGVSDFRRVTQRFASGRELPIEYSAVRLGGNAGIIVVGKNLQAIVELQSRVLAAQQARERDYWKLREVETRYRLVLDAADEPVLLVRPGDLRILEANSAALRAGGFEVGADLETALAPEDRAPARAMLARAREHGRAPGIRVHCGPERTAWLVRAGLRPGAGDSGAGDSGAGDSGAGGSGAEPALLLQLASVGRPPRGAAALSYEPVVERLPDGFVLLDSAGIVRRANRAFLELVQAGALPTVLGEKFGRWLSRPGADAAVLLASVQRHRVVRLFSTTIQGELGTVAEVEISAAMDAELRPRHIGVVLRDIGPRLPSPDLRPAEAAASGRAREPVGNVPLLQRVKAAGEAIERHYIEQALRQTDGNRTAAAALLGLSRQSLYAKLGRQGPDDGSPQSAGAAPRN